MNTKLVEEIRRNLTCKITSELAQIWRENQTEYSAEAFAAVKLLLEGRGIFPPPQLPRSAVVQGSRPAPKCPVELDEKAWIEESMLWLISEFGLEFLRRLPVIQPTPEFFPDSFSDDAQDVQKLVNRVCDYMGVDPSRLTLEFYSEDQQRPHQFMPSGMPLEWSHSGTAGHYRKVGGKVIIGIEASRLQDPMSLVATIAHELGHELLLGDGRISRSREDHEQLTDLLTVFWGMGIFTANSVFNFSQWTSSYTQGWSARRLGYLTEPMFGYALALFAWIREESKPAWAQYLEGDAGAYCKRGIKYLEASGDSLLRPGLRPHDYAAALVGLGNTLDFRGDLDSAIQTYNKAIEFDPRNVLAYLSRGLTRADQGAKDEALADFNQAIELDPNCVGAYYRRGLVRHDQGDSEVAIEDFTKVIELDPFCALAYADRGNARAKGSDLEGAIADCNRSIEINPCNPFAYLSRGNVQAQQEDWAKAVADYTTALEFDPSSPLTYLSRGYARKESGDLAGAIADYDDSLDLNPNYADTYCYRGYARQKQGDLDGAITDFKQAIRLNRDYADAYLGRGIARMDQGDLKRAIADLDHALTLDNTLASAFLHRGVALMLCGEDRQARLDFDRCLKLDGSLKPELEERIKEAEQD